MSSSIRNLMGAVVFSVLSVSTMDVIAETPPFPFPELFANSGELFPLPVPIDIDKLVEEALKRKADALAAPEISAQFAKFVRNYYEALLDEGFTAQEALEIVTATGIPSIN